MERLFVSYVEEDGELVRALAAALEARGLPTWYYQRDSVPGRDYVAQIIAAIGRAPAVVVVISQQTFKSDNVDREIARAYDKGKPLIPLLRELSYEHLRNSRETWEFRFGPTTAVLLRDDAFDEALTALVRGLDELGIRPAADTGDQARPSPNVTLGESPPAAPARRRWPLPAATAAVLAIATTTVVLRARGGPGPEPATVEEDPKPREMGQADGASASEKAIPPGDVAPPPAAETPNKRRLFLGSKGDDVADLRATLRVLGYLDTRGSPAEERIFGPETRDAVMRYQKDRNVFADGILGPQSLAALKGLARGRSK